MHQDQKLETKPVSDSQVDIYMAQNALMKSRIP